MSRSGCRVEYGIACRVGDDVSLIAFVVVVGFLADGDEEDKGERNDVGCEETCAPATYGASTAEQVSAPIRRAGTNCERATRRK